MPIVITKDTMEAQDEVKVEELLHDKHGNLTPMGETIDMFLDTVDWTALFEEEDDRDNDYVETETVYVQPGPNNEFVDCDEDDEGATAVEIESIPGKILGEIVDMDDMVAMFEWFLGQLPAGTLEEKARLAAWGVDVSEDWNYQPWDKRSFKKIHKAGGKKAVARMLGAMLHKGVIRKLKGKARGTGKYKGDYMRTGTYKFGKPADVEKWEIYTKRKEAEAASGKATGKAATAARAARGDMKIALRFLNKTEKQKEEEKAKKAKGKKGGLAKKKKAKPERALPAHYRKVAAHDAGAVSNLTENQGPNLAANILGEMNKLPKDNLTEDDE